MKEKKASVHSEVFPPAKCAAGCGELWEKWCRGCNLVYCVAHVDREQHKCAHHDRCRPTAKIQSATTRRLKKAQSVAPAQLPGPDLFVPPPPNGVASAPGAH